MVKIFKRVIAGGLLAALLMSAIACGQGDSSTPDSTAPQSQTAVSTASESSVSKEPITLTLSTEQVVPGIVPGVQSNPVADAIKEKTGITMNIISADTEKVKVLLAGGDLPDIMLVAPDQGKVALTGKAAMPLKKLLETNGKDILANQASLDVINNRLGNTDGEYYFIPNGVVPDAKTYTNYSPWIGWYTRWDLYKEQGYPELKSYDDMIPMLAAEMKAHPTTDEGKKVYGISGWTDWGLWFLHVPFIYAEGWTENTKNTCTKPDGTYVHRYAADGPLWRGIEFYNKAYRAGILDPDCFTMKYADYDAKLKAGQLLTSHAGWLLDGANSYFQSKGQSDKGFVAQVVEGAISQANSLDSIVGLNDPWKLISKSCKNPERAMDLLNFFSTPEGARLIGNGIQGVHWDIENGKPEMKDEIIKQSVTDTEYNTKTGINLYGKFSGLGGSYIMADGSYINLMLNDKVNKTKLTKLDEDYSKYYGGSYPGDAWNNLLKQGKVKDLSPYYIPALPALQPQSGDDINKLESNIEQILTKEYAKAVMAKTDEDFQAQKARIMKLVNDAGFAQVDAFWKDSYQKGLETYQSLTGK